MAHSRAAALNFTLLTAISFILNENTMPTSIRLLFHLIVNTSFSFFMFIVCIQMSSAANNDRSSNEGYFSFTFFQWCFQM